jgi:L-ascorbate metabolism protein UlaG (beta-lactamase superfamily)
MSGERGSACASIVWLGHSTVLIELDGVRLITDPVLRDRIGPLVRVAEPPEADAARGVDAVLLSHLHADHADPPSLRRVSGQAPILAPMGATEWLRSRGFRDVRELAPGDEARIGDVSIAATPAVHEGRRWPRGPLADAIGFAVRGSRSAYFAGDTDLFDAMSELRGSIDVALLPVWGWGPTLGPGHLDPERAAAAAERIRPRVAIPIHWGTFALSWPARRSADLRRPAEEFEAAVGRSSPEVEVRVLSPGQRTEL